MKDAASGKKVQPPPEAFGQYRDTSKNEKPLVKPKEVEKNDIFDEDEQWMQKHNDIWDEHDDDAENLIKSEEKELELIEEV